MVTDICKNPECRFYDRCFLRPSAAIVQVKTESKLIDTSKFPDLKPIVFYVEMEKSMWIGTLKVGEKITDSIRVQLKKIENDLNTLRGLHVVFDCSGGSGMASEMIERLLLIAKQRMPVVSYIKGALSAAVIPSLAAHRVHCQANGIFGGFGSFVRACDGLQPRFVVTSQSPLKLGQRELNWPPSVFLKGPDDLERKQRALDEMYEGDLDLVSQYRKITLEKLRPVMDGRILLAREALETRLIDGICNQKASYGALLGMAFGHKKRSKR